MHWVARGPEPAKLPALRARYGPKWVRHYKGNTGKKPSDSHWRKFFSQLEQRFHGLCGYCEEECKGEIDHFRPKKLFPELVYDWSNWIVACHSCNHTKRDKWPSTRYVDPCEPSRSSRPEHFFDFDVMTRMIVPMRDLRPGRHKKAVTTIRDLGLNDFHHIKRRLLWLKMVSMVLHKYNKTDPTLLKIIEDISSRDHALSSLSRVQVAQFMI